MCATPQSLLPGARHTWGLQAARTLWGPQGVGRHQEGQAGLPLEPV